MCITAYQILRFRKGLDFDTLIHYASYQLWGVYPYYPYSLIALQVHIGRIARLVYHDTSIRKSKGTITTMR